MRDKLFAAEEAIASLNMENEALNVREAEDRKRIQHLLHLTQPRAEEVTFYKDCRPEYVARNPVHNEPSALHFDTRDAKVIHKSLLYNINLTNEMHPMHPEKHLKEKKKYTQARRQNHVSKAGRVMRTVYLPSDQTDALLLRVDLLTRQLNDQKKLSNERIQSLLNALALASAESKTQSALHGDEMKTKQNEVERIQQLLSKATQDYLVLRHQAQESDRKAQEEIARLHQLQKTILHEKEDIMTNAKLETAAIRESIREEGNVYAAEFRKKAVSRERDIHILKEQYAAVQESYGARIADLQSRLTKLRSRYKSLESRRNMEMEGFSRDIATLKRHLVKLENVCYGTRLTYDDMKSLRTDENNILTPSGLDGEILQLQKRYANLATEISQYYQDSQ
ncbi:Aste57867_19965 [Aphanomyces stellatus]|uniref:Aste57867_19965 protein n=1 Tax=Aphanomyces stellatus TaxID=120398 RepID=A0A485LF27_9STRA|nr:hypothetical protein As57867_019899 [Aphanomyces stellatus]VFT96662.1 Aste57867_19965 [Aphanomyces stellatus]